MHWPLAQPQEYITYHSLCVAQLAVDAHASNGRSLAAEVPHQESGSASATPQEHEDEYEIVPIGEAGPKDIESGCADAASSEDPADPKQQGERLYCSSELL